MRDLFLAAPKRLRAEKLAEYGAYLVDRDGDLDIQRRTLSKRETLIAKHEAPPSATAVMDEEAFRRQYNKFDKHTVPDHEMLLLLGLVKVNSAEAYGVECNFQRTLSRAESFGNDTLLRILCEETYHTRILLSSAKHYGIELRDPYRPPSALRIMINGIATAPDALALPLTLAGELIATLMFTKLLEIVPRVLKHAPTIRDAIEERIVEICTDEHGHISFNRMLAGTLEFAELRAILSATTRVMRTVFPEMVALGAFPTDILRELPLLADPKRIPEPVRRHAFLA